MPDFVGQARGGFLRGIPRHKVNTGAVQGTADGFSQEGAIVAAVVPGQATLVTGRKPKLFQELYGSQGLLAVEYDFAFVIDFHAAKGPHERIGKTGRVTKSMAQGL